MTTRSSGEGHCGRLQASATVKHVGWVLRGREAVTSLGSAPGARLTGRTVRVSLVLYETSTVASGVAAPSCIPGPAGERSGRCTPSQALGVVGVLHVVLTGLPPCPIVFICSSLMTHHVGHLFMSFSTLCMTSPASTCSDLLPIFSRVAVFLLLSFRSSSHILAMGPSSDVRLANTFGRRLISLS